MGEVAFIILTNYFSLAWYFLFICPLKSEICIQHQVNGLFSNYHKYRMKKLLFFSNIKMVLNMFKSKQWKMYFFSFQISKWFTICLNLNSEKCVSCIMLLDVFKQTILCPIIIFLYKKMRIELIIISFTLLLIGLDYHVIVANQQQFDLIVPLTLYWNNVYPITWFNNHCFQLAHNVLTYSKLFFHYLVMNYDIRHDRLCTKIISKVIID